MASKGGMKSFYRQKKNGGVSKSNNKSKTKPSSKKTATVGSDQPQPASLISHGSLNLKDDYNESEEMLRQFDMNMAYGPCIGMTRLARWERANKLGMNPPKDIESFLRGGKVGLECLWNGRV